MLVKSNPFAVDMMAALLLVALLATMSANAAPLIQTSDRGDPAETHNRVLPLDTKKNQALPLSDGTREAHNVRDTAKSTPVTTEATKEPEDKDQLTTWSIAWYLILLGAFIIFFILIGLTEVFCRHHSRVERWHRREGARNTRQPSSVEDSPPSYDLFKPPSYSTLFPLDSMKFQQQKNQEAMPSQPKQLIYVVNVHSGRGVS